MKKMFIAIVALGMIVSSCGDASEDVGVSSPGELTVCDCVDLTLDMMKDKLKGMSEEEASVKYAKKMEACEELGDVKTQEEIDAMNKQAEDCASMSELQKIQQELMTKMMSEQMLEQGAEAIDGGTGNTDESE